MSVVFSLHDFEVDETSAVFCLYDQYIKHFFFSVVSLYTHQRVIQSVRWTTKIAISNFEGRRSLF